MAELSHAIGIDYLYNGQCGVETDSNGLYYMRARYYNQDIKRFINRDVVSGNITNSQSLNRYCYVQGNPVSLIDPFGLCPSEEEIASIKWRNKVSNFFHGALDVGGFFFDGFDLVNAFIYAAEGNNTMAALSLVCMIPGFGTLFGIPAKIVARIGANVGEAFLKAGRQYFPEILEGGSKLFNRTRTQIDNARTWINQKINRLLGKNSDEIVGKAYLKSGSSSVKIQFPENPDDFNPEGLRKIGPFETKNGKIIKWLDENNKAVYEWDEDLTYGSHYHVIGEDGNTRLPNGNGETHFFPGDVFEK